ncbi:unnamed protein product [Calicophoron daubneyi]|uniref:Uncharacterized protein n=1 Tax=Calicophoron daubneyi TaxID=300641 RepID=A0AAV2TTX5_CALDB
MVLPGWLFGEDCSSSFRSLHCFGHLSAKYSVVLISMDGFRHDYLDLFHKRFPNKTLPNFAQVEAKGIRAEFVRSVYPTTTLPTHHTMVTGLYPQHHGAVADQFIDSVHPFKEFSIRRQRSLDNDHWLDEWPEPLWITVQKAGGLVGSHLWPLTDRPAKGDTPFQSVTELALLNNPDGSFTTYPYTKRIHDILWWLKNPRYHLDLILSYFNEPAATGYHSGPESDNVLKKVQRLDELLGQLLDGIHERNLEGKVDLILTSGNGMASFKQIIALDSYVEKSWYEYTQMGASAFLYPDKDHRERVLCFHGLSSNFQSHEGIFSSCFPVPYIKYRRITQ